MQTETGPRPTETERKPKEVVTAKGSIYKYLPDGRTQRIKVATGETMEPQDVLVFIPPWDLIKSEAQRIYPKIFGGIENELQYEEELLHFAQDPNKTMRVVDLEGNELRTNAEVAAHEKIFIAFVDKQFPENSFYLPVTATPKIGYSTFDTRKYGEGEDMRIERHMGNKVVEIR